MKSNVGPPQSRMRKTERVHTAFESFANKRVPMESSAVTLVVNYCSDLANKVLDEAALLAKHRGAKEIDAMDVNMILIKKYNIVMPAIDGVQRVTLHKETLPTTYQPFKYVTATKAKLNDDDDDDDDEGAAEGVEMMAGVEQQVSKQEKPVAPTKDDNKGRPKKKPKKE